MTELGYPATLLETADKGSANLNLLVSPLPPPEPGDQSEDHVVIGRRSLG